MPNPNIHYKEINELLRGIDLKISELESNNSESEYIFRINLTDNKFGINYENFESIKTTLKTLGILKSHILPPKKDIIAFYLYGISTTLLNEIKYHYNFDLQLYMKNKENKGKTVNIGRDMVNSQIGQDSDDLRLDIKSKNEIKQIPTETPIPKSNQDIWDKLKSVAQIFGFLAALIALITKLMDLW